MIKSSWEKFINDMKYAEEIILAGLVSDEVLEDIDFRKVRRASSVDISMKRKLHNVSRSKIIFKTHLRQSNLYRQGKVYIEKINDVRFYIIKTNDTNIIYYVK